MRALLVICVVVAALGCSRKPAAPPPPPPPQPAASVITLGDIAGVHYLERMTGGVRSDERVPMIVALHPMDGDPEAMLEMLQGYRGRARLVVPYGHPSGGMYQWYGSTREDVAAAVVTRETDRLAAAITALAAARPTSGKPIVTGFSQGGYMTFALAVTHPDAIAAAFPISGLLPTTLYPSTALDSSKLPPVVAFHGAADLAVPTQSARNSIAELRRAGFSAELHEYPGVEHATSDAEVADILEQLARAAERQAVR
ncbi:MAG: dienelactone hydrolase family protein [Myxococcaceae bacterium]